ncbi:MAG TPA: ABC transporter substrate-binding protein [Methylomirabilota bacterium]|nr:ABC transporter substrate-binding protein [Methylomirabilota bacterium]
MRLPRIFAVAVVLMLGGPAVTLAQGRADTLVVVTEVGPNMMDIHAPGANRPMYQAAWNMYDRLVTFGSKALPDGGKMYDYAALKPELAESWTVAPDGMSVTFKLRKDAKFHDGSPVTAHDVKWSFDRAVAVGGFPTFQMKAGSLESPEQFTAVDDTTFKVAFIRKDKLTLPDLGVPVAIVINSKLVKKNATAQDPWGVEWLKQNDAGGGAYKLESWKPGQESIYVRYDEWKSGPLPRIRRVIVREVPSAGTRRAMLEKGDADISFELPPKDFAELAKEGKLKVTGIPIENSHRYVGMNVVNPPFNNLKVRQAVAHVLPYEKIFSSAFFGRGILLPTPVASNTFGFDPKLFPYKMGDLPKARALMAEAGQPNGFETTLYYDAGRATVDEPAAVLVQEALAQIGIRAQIEKIPPANWRANLTKKTMPIFLDGFGGWLNYPEYFFFWNYHGQNATFNSSSYVNAEMDKWIDAARFETDQKKYAGQVRNMQLVAMRDVPRLPYVQVFLDVAMQKNITGYQYWFHVQLDFRSLVKG